MLAPSICNNFVSDLSDFADFFRGFGDVFAPVRYGMDEKLRGISTDVQEFDDHYELDMELPGYKKEDIKATVKEGYLTISAEHSEEKDEKDSEGKYLRRERVSGSCARSFFVGKEVTGEMLHASFENGVLKVNVPKVESKKEIPVEQTVSIEG